MEELVQEIDALRLELDERNDQLIIAAQYGQKLLVEMGTLKEDCNQKDEQLEQLSNELEALKAQNAELAAKAEELGKIQPKYSKLLADIEQQEQASSLLEEELSSKKAKISELEEQLEEKTKQNRNLASGMEEKDNTIATLENQVEEQRAIVARTNQLLKSSKDSGVATVERTEELEESLSQALEKARRFADELNTTWGSEKYPQELIPLLDHLRSRVKTVTKTAGERQQASVRELQELLDHERESRDEVREEKETLEHQNRELQALLEEIRGQVASLEKELNKGTDAAALQAQSIKRSILSEIESELENRKTTQAVQVEHAVLPNMGDELSPAENYFYLTALAAKLSLSLRLSSEPNGDILIKDFGKLKYAQLYEQALGEKMEFHSWYEWVQKQYLQLSEHNKSEAGKAAPAASPKKPVNNPVPPSPTRWGFRKNVLGWGEAAPATPEKEKEKDKEKEKEKEKDKSKSSEEAKPEAKPRAKRDPKKPGVDPKPHTSTQVLPQLVTTQHLAAAPSKPLFPVEEIPK